MYMRMSRSNPLAHELYVTDQFLITISLLTTSFIGIDPTNVIVFDLIEKIYFG